MDRNEFYQIFEHTGTSDYERYLDTHDLFACQSNFANLCNGDELQFQTVHQVEELLMKLITYTLLDIDEYMQQQQTLKVLTLFKRVHSCQQTLLSMLDLLGTMSPKAYQEIRQKLGNGSGRSSPGFKAIMHTFAPLWETYQSIYLKQPNITIDNVYDMQFNHNDAYVVAEALIEFEILFHRFLSGHMQVVNRSIGSEAKSIKGNNINNLHQRMETRFFPELWRVRNDMTDRWGKEYGYVRDPLKPEGSDEE